MGTQTADEFVQAVLGDEGWQSGLESDSVEAVIARLETLLPVEATVADDRAARMKLDLRELSALVTSLNAGTLDEKTLVAAWLRGMEA